jgi:hypothetical protein
VTTLFDQQRADLDSLGRLADSEITGAVAIARSPKKVVEAAHLTLKAKADEMLLSLAQNAAREWSSCSVVGYAAAALAADGHPRADVPMFDAVTQGFGDLSNLPQLDTKSAFFRNLEIAATRLEHDGVEGVFLFSFRSDSPNLRSKKKARMIFRSGALDGPSEGTEAVLAKQVTAVLIGDFAFFRDRREFQDMFGLLEEMKEQASATFKLVTENLRIEGFEEMMTAVTSTTTMLGKMASIQSKLEKYPAYKKALTMPKLVAFVKANPACQVEVVGRGSDTRLVFRNDAQHRFKILNLLDDDYLKSELTGLRYEANSKTLPTE